MEQMEIVRSGRKTLAIEIKGDGRVIVRAPVKMPNAEIQRFVQEKAHWIAQHLQKIAQTPQEKFTDAQLKEFVKAAKTDIPERVMRFAPLVGITYGTITIRRQKTRWGSCSSKGNLNFNCLLMCCPEEVRDYVVVHELCHRKELNHSARFWAEVAKILPDYKTRKAWLRKYGYSLIGKLD